MKFIDLAAQQREIKTEIDAKIAAVLAHGQYIMGPEVREVEIQLAEYVDVDFCITVSSGTDALLISLMALGVGPGDEVITSAFSFAAAVEVIIRLGAVPVFVDVDVENANISVQALESVISPKTKAILPVSIYGQCANLPAINRIAARYGGIPVVEDGAQSFGAQIEGRRSCSLSTIGCTSFFPTKPLGCYGDGGAIFTNDPELNRIVREVRSHGQSGKYKHIRIGVGGRMDTLQCGILLAKLTQFDWEIEERGRIGLLYNQAILNEVMNARNIMSKEVGAELDGVRVFKVERGNMSVFAQYTILAPNRNRLIASLSALMVPTMVHYPIPLHRQPAYKNLCKPAFLPVTDWLCEHVVSLPMGPYLTPEDQAHIVQSMSESAALL